MKGTDSADNLDIVDIAKKAYQEYQTAIILTGESDVIVQDDKVVKLQNGSHFC